jgi:5S rRNA maturation endonuclease (ribonuclease M5)
MTEKPQNAWTLLEERKLQGKAHLLNRLKEKEEKITETLSALVEESAQGTPILVEGKKDIEALRALGVEGKIVSVKTGGKSLLSVTSAIENAKTEKIILLLDFDRRGIQATNRLRSILERAGIKVNLEAWLALLRSAGKDVKCIEGLNAYLERLRVKIGKRV